MPVLMPVALDQTYDYLVPEGIERRRAASCLCRSGRRAASVSSGTRQSARSMTGKTVESAKPKKKLDRRKMKAVAHRLDAPCLPVISLRFRRVDRALHAGPARHGGAHDDERAMRRSSRSRRGSAFAIVAGAPEPPRMTPARRKASWTWRRMVWSGLNPLSRTRLGCSTGVIDGLVRIRQPRRGCDPGKVFPRPEPQAHDASSSQIDQAGQSKRCVRQWMEQISRCRCSMASRGRARRRFITRRWRAPRSRAPGGDHAAGNRADRAVHEPFQGAVRLPAGRVAFRVVAAGARADVEGGGDAARPAWWSAHDRRFFCPTKISG